MSVWPKITKTMNKRVILLDGAMGTMLQLFNLDEKDFHGTRFANHKTSLKGNNDLLNISAPEKVKQVHDMFLAAGADMIETNSFNATSISQQDYGLADIAPKIAKAGAKIAREIADEWTAKTPNKPRAVLGALGPLSKTLSLSPKVEDPGFRDLNFDEVVKAYYDQIYSMFDYIDALLIETIFDTLNAKAAIFAAQSVFEQKSKTLPLLISGTITDASGRTLSGQTVEAFWISIKHAKPFAVGLNCALGAKEMSPYIRELAKLADCYIMSYPNAGLPNEFGEYDESPEQMGGYITPWLESGYVNIIGGCCGSTPEHIKYLARIAKNAPPHQTNKPRQSLQLSGLEAFKLDKV